MMVHSMCHHVPTVPFSAAGSGWEAESWLQTFYVFFPLFFMPFPSFPEDLRHRMRAVTRVTPPDIISPPPPIILFRSQRDGTEELFTLPNANAILRRPNIRQQTCKECLFPQSIRNRSPQYHHRVEALQTGRPSRHRGIWGKRRVCMHLLSCYIKPNICTDSTVQACVMKTLNERYQQGLDLFLLSINEGITGYCDDSI